MAHPGFHRIHRHVATLVSNVSGATAVEYALMAVMLAFAVFGSMQILQVPVTTMYDRISSAFEAAR